MSCACPALPSGTPALATSLGSIGTLRPAETGSFVQITPGWTVLTRIRGTGLRGNPSTAALGDQLDASSQTAPECRCRLQVRTRLAAGGSEIRTLGSRA